MKALLTIIALSATLWTTAVAEQKHVHQGSCHDHKHEVRYIARASKYRAVCSKGDLNATYSSRSAAVKAAQKHKKATGHSVSVKKQ